jgi:hypothetical protein
MWIAACIAALLLLGLGGILFALTRSSSKAAAAGSPAKPGAPTPASPGWWSKVKFGPGWVFPILVWVAFWISLYRYLPSTWNYVCDDPWIFWLAQGIYLVMIIGGRNLTDKDKKPRKPSYPKWVLFATICIVAYGKLHSGASYTAPPKPPAKQGSAGVAKASPKPEQSTTAAKMEEEGLPPIDVTVVVPGSDSRSKREIVAPVGYEISEGAWTSKVQLVAQTELNDGSVASTFVSRAWEPVEVTFHLVPKK